MQNQRYPQALLLGSLAIVIILIALAPVFGRLLNSLPAVLFLLIVYWVGILSLAMVAAPRATLAALYRTPVNRRPLELALTWLPVVATFLLVFFPSASRVPLSALAVIAVIAIMNGMVEELFWRGAFQSVFQNNFLLAYIYPSVLFSLWHVALALLPEVRYPHGPIALIGGASALGLAWGWVVWRTRDLRSVSIAHAMTNFFAFVGPALLTGWVP